ncbi:MAG: hypothetical protein RIE52_00305 [Balneola sp.]|jgi:hypothetical protein
MKTSLYIGLLFVTVGSAAFLSNFENHELPVGTVVHSVLPPEFFNAEYMGEWELLMGQKLNDESRLYDALEKYSDRTLLDSLPDARGYFIRSMNHIVGANPQENITIGSVQNDATKLPNNNFRGRTTPDGNHTHRITGTHANGIGTNREAQRGAGDSNPDEYTSAKGVSDSGNHRHSVNINSGGDEETRPKNISLYVYIKIN